MLTLTITYDLNFQCSVIYSSSQQIFTNASRNLTDANALPRVAPVFCGVYPHTVGVARLTAAAGPVVSDALLTDAREPFSVEHPAGGKAYVGKPDRAVSPTTGDIM